MGDILSNPLIVGVLASVLAGLILALFTYLVSRLRTPSLPALYKKALREAYAQLAPSSDVKLSRDDKAVLRKALTDSTVVKAIETEALGPDEEAQRLCNVLAHLAPPVSPLSDATCATTVVAQLLYAEFIIEGRYHAYHERSDRRHSYFERPSAPTGLKATEASQQITLTWNPVPNASVHADIWRYHIDRATGANGPFTEVGILPAANTGSSPSFTDDKGLTNDTTYYYKVIAETKALRRAEASPISAVPHVPHVSPPPNSQSSPIPAPTTALFKPLEYMQGVAEKCIDREHELDKLRADFANPRRRLIIIEGFGGMGKTTLAARLATAISEHYKVLWFDCKDLAFTAERILFEVGRFASEQCNYPWLAEIIANSSLSEEQKISGLIDFLKSSSKPGSEVKSQVSQRSIALFFDNYHRVKDAKLKQLIEKIVEHQIDVKVVLVIRHRLSLPLELQTLVNAADTLSLQGLDLGGCREFIEAYATSFPVLADLDEKTLLHVWERTGQGVPQALRLLIPNTRARSLHDVLQELPDYNPLTSAYKVWFENLFIELSPAEQQVAIEASIFRQPPSRPALRYISRCARVDKIIDELVDLLVLTFEDEHYSMHALWSEYTRQLLSLDDASELHRRAAMFYRDLVSADRYTTIMNCRESCYHFLKAEDIEQAEAVLIPIAGTLRSWGLFQELTNILAEIEKRARGKDRPLDPLLRLEQSAVLSAQGEIEQATAIFKELAETNAGEVEITALQHLAWINIETDNRREAERLLERSKQLAHQYHLAKLEGEAIHGLQYIAYIESNYTRALEYNEQHLKICQHIKDEEGRARTYHGMGNVHRERGLYNKAMEFYQQELDVWHAFGDPPGHVGWVTYDMGQVLFGQGKLEEAQRKFKEALQLFENMQYISGIAHTKIELGRVSSKLDQDRMAIDQLEEAITMLQKIKGTAGEAYGLRALGEVYLQLADPDNALPYLQQSLEIDEKTLGGKKGMASSLHRISLAHEQQGRRLLNSGNRAEATSRFCEAKASIVRAQELFAQLDAIPNFGGILDDSERIEQEYAQCSEA